MTGRHGQEAEDGSRAYWRNLHARLAAEGRFDVPADGRYELSADGPADVPLNRAIPPAPDPFAALNMLEAAGYLQAMKEAAELVDGIHPYDEQWRDELEQLRAEARAVFERKFFQVNP
jgi:hypothetical protein